MKVGDSVPVTIAGQPIAQAVVKEIDTTVEPWTVRMVVPGTVVVMSMRAQLAPEITQEGDPATNVLLTDGVVKPEEVNPKPPAGDGTVNLATTQDPGGDPSAPVDKPIGEGLAETVVIGSTETATISPEVEAAVEEKATE